LSIERIEII